MKKSIGVLLVCVLCISFASCGLFDKGWVAGSATIAIPDDLFEKREEVTESQIEWFMASSNEWNVTVRTAANGEETVEGSQIRIDESYQSITTHVYTRNFTPDDRNPQEIFDLSDGEQRSVSIKLYKVSTGENFYTNVVFRLSERVYVQVIESSPDKARALTMEALQSLSALFWPHAEQYRLLQQNGSIKELEKPSMSANSDYGSYIFTGFAHAEGFNEARIQVLDSETGILYYDQLEYESEQFSIGWSENDADYFCFSQKLIVPIPFYGKGPLRAHVTVQLWVEETGGASYCAASTQLEMEFWQR